MLFVLKKTARICALILVSLSTGDCTPKPHIRMDEDMGKGTLTPLEAGTHVFAKGGLRLRAEPNENARIIALIPDLSRIRVPGEEKHSIEFDQENKESGWVRASYQGKSGFVSREFLKTILSAKINKIRTFEILEVVRFPSQRGEYMLDSEFYLRDSGKLTRLPKTYRETSEPTWVDDRYAVFRTHFGDGGGGSDDTYKIDSIQQKVELLHGSYFFMSETGHCDQIAACLCGGSFYRFRNKVYYLEGSEKTTTFYIVPEDAHADGGKCMHGIIRDRLRKIKTVAASQLNYNEKFYDGLQFSNGKDAYTIQTDGFSIK